ncbi:UNVERIFIED_ORG: hypothetical protein DFO82_0345 [Idiomarina abyssalis]|jgi:DUF1365 family protein|uniref:Uncharacterized conserved protein n=1 Tax=Idiomarina loihiensis (strain ATCC BAA-735 / DSM 15497 / L2-TR) TaxID=283942 RepID=Q5QZ73_IDILO|nr:MULTISPECIES: DUF1365 domain-containing protein [Idiomarina]NWO02862.1 DUF1365 domain-containing protein [Idiomarinaceae bacterium]HAS23455.1 DUF1365 domain-containing protein [Idiomarina loihiensis]AAV82224.1 Uncharacterized conserved protein [Idiomarina loihiensis L2TR]AGM36254.1 hypothetical protein K734_06955 [Idiomarina loihiensis GSL 199]TDO53655.1 hypothetical protein DEU30_101695 [Idiomarina sp. 017G]
MKSAIYWGDVFHVRHRPKHHAFNYRFQQWCIDLSELDQVSSISRWLSCNSFAPLWFRRKDYLKDEEGNLHQAALKKMSSLAGKDLTGQVLFVGNLRTFGIFFSPINLYFLRQDNDEYTHMLAEVSNTPWLQRHYYLVDLSEECPETVKQFHVSPFNPMDMTYHWQIEPPTESLKVTLSAHQQEKDFVAGMKLNRQPLNRTEVYRVLRTTPVMALKIIGGIYWQALKLFIKRVPFYGNPGN